MWAFVVPVVDEFVVGGVDWGFVDVRFVESFNLSDRGWSAYACDDMFDAISSAELSELWDASSGRVELGSSIR